ncbi:HNH endonuclease [Arthrospira platensis SPKY2]
MKEIWKPMKFKDVKDMYLISNTRLIKNKYTNKLINGGITKKGYKVVCLQTNNGKQRTVRVHQAIIKNFKLFKPKNKDTVNHIDGNKLNNYYSNLEWATQKEQVVHAYRNNLITVNKGEELYNTIYTEDFIIQICDLIDEGFDKASIIAKKLNVSNTKNFQYLIHDIKKGKSWKYISNEYNWFGRY